MLFFLWLSGYRSIMSMFLETILSGKEVIDTEHEKEVLLSAPPKKKNFTRKKRSGSKSFSDLEFEELKGFMDLGFAFTKEDKYSNLASIIPGMHRLGKKNEEYEDSNDDVSLVQRPYFYEAWKVLDEIKKKENPLMNEKVPSITIDINCETQDWLRTRSYPNLNMKVMVQLLEEALEEASFQDWIRFSC
ncbi:unnamed protein product [Lupinus luteus]|uniref:Uncharacterized protein n=1 Tax=Lupinus luteus TaxID=3873 RepID=A0AAV1XA59_LUPLU